MNKLNILFLLPILFFISAAVANDNGSYPGPNGENYVERMKQKVLKGVNFQIGVLEKFRDCVSAAADGPALKKCQDEWEAAMKAFVASKKQEQIKRIEQQQKELEKEKSQLQQQGNKP